MLRLEGVLGPLTLTGHGRDRTVERVLAESTVELEVAYLDGRRVTAVRAAPWSPALDGLVGQSAAAGFRTRLVELLGAEHRSGSLRHQLLDDVPVAALVSGYAIGAASADTDVAAALPPAPRHRGTPDLCAGWARGGTIMIGIDAIGRAPLVTGPPEPAGGLPAGEADDLGPHGMRRRRRTDVVRSGGDVLVTSWFRDSHQSADGRRTVIHEYDVDVVVDATSWEVRTARAVPRVLPFVECPAAAGSAGWLVGRSLLDLRAEVRSDFTGTSTCTHLNDQLRSLADVPALAAATRP